ncbi:ricin-type beta-trefoil lectin domain protein [Kitasatospora sp. NPDC056327]|uniref:ricin-type beta-trefoil lectin domain protein n=1 Tax=Kitasatospora sp. NPDC056327 TaxID=3345785 RepID=UPI0035E193B1
MRRTAAALASLVLAGAAALASPGTASADDDLPGPTITAPIVGVRDLCLAIRSTSPTEYRPVQVWDCDGSAAQYWRKGVNGTLQALGKCLDVWHGGTRPGTPVGVYECNGTGSQQWQYTDSARFYNPQSGLCLNVPLEGTAGVDLNIWNCYLYAPQRWRFAI